MLQKENADTVYGNIDAKCMTDMIKDETLRKRKPGHYKASVRNMIIGLVIAPIVGLTVMFI